MGVGRIILIVLLYLVAGGALAMYADAGPATGGNLAAAKTVYMFFIFGCGGVATFLLGIGLWRRRRSGGS